MKFTKYLAISSLLAVASSIQLSEEPRPFEDEFCMNKVEGGFDTNQPGLYDGSAVTQIDGDQAIQVLTSKTHLNDKTEFVAAYHPQCPHCHTMVADFKKLAQDAKDKNLPLEIVAINMSKTDPEKAGIEGFPTVRLYTKEGEMKEFEAHRNIAQFEQFLKLNGFDFGN